MIKGQIVGKLILQADYSNSDAIKQMKGKKKKVRQIQVLEESIVRNARAVKGSANYGIISIEF